MHRTSRLQPVKLQSLTSARTTGNARDGLIAPTPNAQTKGLNGEEGNYQGGNLKHESQSKLIQIIFHIDKAVRK